MPELTTEFAIAETYLKQMLEADDSGNYDLYIKHFESKDLIGFTKERFDRDVKQMHERNGLNVGYEYFGSLKAPREDSTSANGHYEGFRFIWKGIYEKREALIVIGIHKKDAIWYLNNASVH